MFGFSGLAGRISGFASYIVIPNAVVFVSSIMLWGWVHLLQLMLWEYHIFITKRMKIWRSLVVNYLLFLTFLFKNLISEIVLVNSVSTISYKSLIQPSSHTHTHTPRSNIYSSMQNSAAVKFYLRRFRKILPI